MTPARIVVREPNWLGDVVMSLPALRSLRHAFPEARLSVVIRAELASFFTGSRWIEELIVPPRARGLRRVRALAELTRTIRSRQFDLAVLFPNSFESALPPFLARVPRRVGLVAGDARSILLTDVAKEDSALRNGHQSTAYLEMLRRTLGIEGDPAPVAPDVDPLSRAKVEAWIADRRRDGAALFALAPAAAYGPAKEWPVDRYALLADLLQERRGAQAVLVGSPGERPKCEAVASASRAKPIIAAGETTVGELVALLSLCDGFVGNDSGPMHVAAALGLPTVGIFGSTSPERSAPLGPRAVVLRENLPCSPCFDRTCRFGHYDCLTRIGSEAALAALARVSGAVSG